MMNNEMTEKTSPHILQSLPFADSGLAPVEV